MAGGGWGGSDLRPSPPPPGIQYGRGWFLPRDLKTLPEGDTCIYFPWNGGVSAANRGSPRRYTGQLRLWFRSDTTQTVSHVSQGCLRQTFLAQQDSCANLVNQRCLPIGVAGVQSYEFVTRFPLCKGSSSHCQKITSKSGHVSEVHMIAIPGVLCFDWPVTQVCFYLLVGYRPDPQGRPTSTPYLPPPNREKFSCIEGVILAIQSPFQPVYKTSC